VILRRTIFRVEIDITRLGLCCYLVRLLRRLAGMLATKFHVDVGDMG
jgi:hypothetical protein